MTTFDDHHWSSEIEKAAAEFFTSDSIEKIFLWVENERLLFDYKSLASSKSQGNTEIMVFVKVLNEKITIANVASSVFVK